MSRCCIGIFVAFVVSAGCIEDGDETTLGDLFGSLGGRYLIPEENYHLPETRCYIKISGSSVTAVDQSGQAPCEEEFYDDEYDENDYYALSVEGTITEDKISGTMIYTEAWSYLNDGCEERTTMEDKFVADIRLDEGRSADGKFSSLAGTWSGSLTHTYSYVEELTTSPECNDDWDDISDSHQTGYEIQAEVRGDDAIVTYKGPHYPEPEFFFVEMAGNEEIIVAGERVAIH
jgi:hypothetical protein